MTLAMRVIFLKSTKRTKKCNTFEFNSFFAIICAKQLWTLDDIKRRSKVSVLEWCPRFHAAQQQNLELLHGLYVTLLVPTVRFNFLSKFKVIQVITLVQYVKMTQHFSFPDFYCPIEYRIYRLSLLIEFETDSNRHSNLGQNIVSDQHLKKNVKTI